MKQVHKSRCISTKIMQKMSPSNPISTMAILAGMDAAHIKMEKNWNITTKTINQELSLVDSKWQWYL